LFNGFLLPSQVFLNQRFGIGQNIFNTDWNLLIILDCCRSDALNELTEEYDFIDGTSSIFSVGGRTTEWMSNTFTKDHKEKINDTAYITNAPGAVMVFENRFEKDHYGGEISDPANLRVKKFGNKNYVNDYDFGHFKGIYKSGLECKSCISAEKNTSARSLTNYAVNLDRKEKYDRVVLHYMIPHYPFFATRSCTGDMAKANELYENINILLKRRDQTWEAYLDNIRWALEEVSLLLNNIEREKVVITSDHGMSFLNKPGSESVSGSFNPKIRKVPWIVTSATDKQTHLPDSIVPNI